MAVTTAVEDLFKSVYELFASVVGTVVTLVQTFLNAILSFFSGFVNMIAQIFSGVVDVVGGVGKFIFGTLGSSLRWRGIGTNASQATSSSSESSPPVAISTSSRSRGRAGQLPPGRRRRIDTHARHYRIAELRTGARGGIDSNISWLSAVLGWARRAWMALAAPVWIVGLTVE